VFAVENVLNDVVLRDDCRRFGGGAVALQGSDDLECFFVLAFADQEARRIGQEGAKSVDAKGKEELERERKAPCDVARREREAEGEPIGDAEAGDAIR
jgi:hypothetical protein